MHLHVKVQAFEVDAVQVVGGVRFVVFSDPDGNRQVVQERPPPDRFMSGQFSRAHVFDLGTGDLAWRQTHGDPCAALVDVIARETLLGWPGGVTAPMRPLSGSRRHSPSETQSPVVAGFHPGQPAVLQMRHPHPAHGHDLTSRDTPYADQQCRLQGPKAGRAEPRPLQQQWWVH